MDVVEENFLVKRVAKQAGRGQSKGGAAFPRADRGQAEYEARPIAV
jgi:hypothetical protein